MTWAHGGSSGATLLHCGKRTSQPCWVQPFPFLSWFTEYPASGTYINVLLAWGREEGNSSCQQSVSWGPAISLNKAPVSSSNVRGAALIMNDGTVPRLRITPVLKENRERGSLSRYQGVTCKSLTRSREEPEQGQTNEPWYWGLSRPYLRW